MSRFQKLLKAENKDLVVLNNGKQSEESLELITNSSNAAFIEFENNPDRYKMLVSNPTLAKNNEEKIGIMSAREIILLIDKMTDTDVYAECPNCKQRINMSVKWLCPKCGNIHKEKTLITLPCYFCGQVNKEIYCGWCKEEIKL